MLEEILEELSSHFTTYGNENWVKGCIPILFFGDLEAYLASEKKIITVGLNPSDKEFARGKQRFNTQPNLLKNREDYLYSLSEYFKCNPYGPWFSSYDNLLKKFGSSFYSGEKNTALHTDFITPLATSPTWTKLSKDVLSEEACNNLFMSGNKIWQLLIDILKPDFILGAIGQKHIKKAFPSVELEPISPPINGSRPHQIRLFNYKDIPFFHMLADNRRVPAFPKEQAGEVASHINAYLNKKLR